MEALFCQIRSHMYFNIDWVSVNIVYVDRFKYTILGYVSMYIFSTYLYVVTAK